MLCFRETHKAVVFEPDVNQVGFRLQNGDLKNVIVVIGVNLHVRSNRPISLFLALLNIRFLSYLSF